MSEQTEQSIETLVIGGGQAGLAMGYHLQRLGIPFSILDANPRVGDAWRNRWDSLRLFTTARFNSLPGLRFPGPGDAFPSKDEAADYLKSYAEHFRLPVQTGVRVERLSRQGRGFVITAGAKRYEAANVVVAMANYQRPRLPKFAEALNPHTLQMHSHFYKSSDQLKKGNVLIVGVGNSGADIAIEIAGTHPTWLSGKESGHVPYRIESFFGRHIGIRLIRFIGHRVLALNTPFGRKARPNFLHRSPPLIRVQPEDLIAAGIQRVGRVVGVKDGKPLLEGGRTLEVENVIWCTGYEPGFSWIDLPVFDDAGDPIHVRGVAQSEPGLYFLGLQFLFSMTSATLNGVGRDARHIAKAIASRARLTPRFSPQLVEVGRAS
jgi:putative flavoprotein involved in K+ transport